MTSGRKTILDTIAYGLQGALPQLLQLIMLPVFTRVLTKEDYGVVNLVVAFAAIVSGFVAFQLPSAIGRFYFEYEDKKSGGFFTAILIVSAAIGSVVVGSLMLLGEWVVGVFYPKAGIPFYPLFFLAMISTWLGVIATTCSTMLQVQQKASVLLRNTMFLAVLQTSISFYLVVVLKWGPLGVLMAGTISSFAGSSVLLWLVRKSLASPDWSVIPSSTKYGMPLILHFFGAFLFTTSDLIVLEKYTDLATVGLYAVAVRLASPLSICVEAFNRANSPIFMKQSKVSKTETVATYRTLITKWMSFALVGWIGFCFFAPEVLVYVVPPKFHGVNDFIPILAASYIFRGLYCFAGQSLFFEKKTNWIPVITLSAGIVNVVLNIVLIPQIGVVAAVWTTVISYAISFVIALVLSNRIYPLEWEARKMICMSVVAIVCVICMESTSIESTTGRIMLKVLAGACCAAVLFVMSGVLANRFHQGTPLMTESSD